MDLTKIVSISGKSGLFKVVSQGKNVVIVESLADQKRVPVFGHEKMSSLEEISVFTTGEDRPLKEVFKAFHEKLEGKPAADPKSENPVVLKFFLEMVPDYSQEKVYVSDVRKMISWYNILAEHQLLDFTEEKEEQKDTADQAAEAATPTPETMPAVETAPSGEKTPAIEAAPSEGVTPAGETSPSGENTPAGKEIEAEDLENSRGTVKSKEKRTKPKEEKAPKPSHKSSSESAEPKKSAKKKKAE